MYRRTPLLKTDLKGMTFFSVVGGFLLLPRYEINESSFIGQGNNFYRRRNFVTSGSGIAGFDCILFVFCHVHVWSVGLIFSRAAFMA